MARARAGSSRAGAWPSPLDNPRTRDPIAPSGPTRLLGRPRGRAGTRAHGPRRAYSGRAARSSAPTRASHGRGRSTRAREISSATSHLSVTPTDTTAPPRPRPRGRRRAARQATFAPALAVPRGQCEAHRFAAPRSTCADSRSWDAPSSARATWIPAARRPRRTRPACAGDPPSPRPSGPSCHPSACGGSSARPTPGTSRPPAARRAPAAFTSTRISHCLEGQVRGGASTRSRHLGALARLVARRSGALECWAAWCGR